MHISCRLASCHAQSTPSALERSNRTLTNTSIKDATNDVIADHVCTPPKRKQLRAAFNINRRYLFRRKRKKA